ARAVGARPGDRDLPEAGIAREAAAEVPGLGERDEHEDRGQQSHCSRLDDLLHPEHDSETDAQCDRGPRVGEPARADPLRKQLPPRALAPFEDQRERARAHTSTRPLYCAFPMSPDGRTIKVRINTAIAIALTHVPVSTRPPTDSAIPSTRPPTRAPYMLPRPPSTEMTNASSVSWPGVVVGLNEPTVAIIVPATPASAAEMPNVIAYTC